MKKKAVGRRKRLNPDEENIRNAELEMRIQEEKESRYQGGVEKDSTCKLTAEAELLGDGEVADSKFGTRTSNAGTQFSSTRLPPVTPTDIQGQNLLKRSLENSSFTPVQPVRKNQKSHILEIELLGQLLDKFEFLS